MAKKRRASRTKVVRRRKMGASSASKAGSMVTQILGITAGAIIAKKVDSLLPNLNPTVRNAAKVALGVALPMVTKVPLMASVGQGMIAVGASSLVGGLVPALGATDEVLILSGVDEISEVNGVDEIGEINDISEVNGVDEIGEMDEFE
jgi:hypothetical protein